MKKGQISFDLMFAVISIMLFAQSLNVLAGQMELNQNIISIRTQAKQTANGLAVFAQGMNSISNDADASISVSYKIPKIIISKEEELENCSVSIGDSTIAVTVTYAGQPIPAQTTLAAGSIPAGLQGNYSCGGTIS